MALPTSVITGIEFGYHKMDNNNEDDIMSAVTEPLLQNELGRHHGGIIHEVDDTDTESSSSYSTMTTSTTNETVKKVIMRDWQDEIEDVITTGDVGQLQVAMTEEFHERNGISVPPPPYLHMAAIATRNAVQMIQILVKNADMDINLQDRDGRTALHVSLQELDEGNHDSTLDVFTALLDLECDPCISDITGETCLHILAKKPSTHVLNEFMNRLLFHVPEFKRSIFVKFLDNTGKSALYYAMDNLAFNRTCQLLRLSTASFQGDPTGTVLLHGVIRKLFRENQLDVQAVVTMLLKRGCDPQACDERGQTALHIWAKYGLQSSFGFHRFVDTIILYVPRLERNAFLHARDREGNSAIYYASRFQPDLVCDLLDLSLGEGMGGDPYDDDGTSTSILHNVAQRGSVHSIIRLLKHGGYNPRAQNEHGQTILHILAKYSLPYMFNQIVDAMMIFVPESERFDYVNTIDGRGKSALYSVTRKDLFPIKILKLLELSADPFIGNPNGISILHQLLQFGLCDTDFSYAVILLLQRGCDPHGFDEGGNTPLHIMVKKQSSGREDKSKIVNSLLDYGADSMIEDVEGNPPLCYLGNPLLFDASTTFLLLQHMVGKGVFH